MTTLSKEAMLPTCKEICEDKRWTGTNATAQRKCLGGNCLYLADHYDKFAIPDLSIDDAHELYMSATIFTIANIDIEEGSVEVEMRLRMHWLDNRMRACKCDDRGNRKGIHLSEAVEKDIWLPDLILVNDLHTEYELDAAVTGGIFLVSHDLGVGVYYDIRLDAAISCDFDLTWYPFDKNICLLRLASRVPVSKMKIIMKKLPELKMNTTGNYKLEVGSLCASETKNCTVQSSYSQGEGQCVGAFISFTRDDILSIVIGYSVIFGVMMIMTTLVVILPKNDRLGPIGLTLLGALTVYYTVSFENAVLWTPRIVFVFGGVFICFSSVVHLTLLLHCGRGQADRWDVTYLVVGLVSAVLLTVVVWVVGYVMAADACEEGTGVCYHNRMSCHN